MIAAVLLTPGTSLVLGLLIFVGIAVVSRVRSGARTAVADGSAVTDGRRRMLRRLALIAPWVIVAPFLLTEGRPYVDTLLRYAAPDFAATFVQSADESRWWWVFVGPPLAATVCVLVALIVLAGEKSTPQVPVAPVVRRGLTTFSPRRDVVIPIAALATLLVTILIAGSASSPGDGGWYTRIEFPVGDMGYGSSTFFGWGFGLPAAGAVALLSLATGSALRVNVSRPFARPETVAEESAARRSTAAVLIRLFTATVLLVLGGAWALIGSAGMGSSGVGIPGVGQFWFSPGYASFAPAFVVAGVAMQTVAVVMLLLTIRMRSRQGSPIGPALRAATPAAA